MRDGGKLKPSQKKKQRRAAPPSEPPQLELTNLDVDQLLDFDPADAKLRAAPEPAAQHNQQRTVTPNKGKGKRGKPAAAAEAPAEAQPAVKRVKRSEGAGEAAGAAAAAGRDADGDDEEPEPSIQQHRAELEALIQQDPEFYAYLKETDEDLLAFGIGEGDDSEEEDELSEASHDAADEQQADSEEEGDDAFASRTQAAAKAAGGLEITETVAKQCCEAAKASASLGSVHQLLKVYRAACHYSDTEQETDMALRITSSRAFNRIMLFTLREADGLLRRILDNTDAAADRATDVTRLPRWRKAEPLAKSFLGNTLHILGNMTNASMQAFILRRLRASVVFLRPFEKLTRKLLKAALQLFGTADDHAVRVQAILFIRQVAILLPQPARDMCLKGVIRTYSANAKFSSPYTAAHLSFMASCIVELFGLNEEAAYAHAFTAIKDLAVSLRGALSMKTADAFRAVYCWQTVRCLELWSRVLAEHVNTELRALVYPLVQVLLGAARLVPAPRYFPLRLRLARGLHRLAFAAGVLVPLSPLLLEMLHWSDLSKAPQAAAGQPPDLQTALRVSKSALRTAAFQEEVVTQVLQLLAEHLAQWSCSVAFPELGHLTSVQLRSLAKALPAERFRTQAKALVAAIDRNSAFVGRARDAVTFSPKDLAAADAFLSKEREARKAPMQQYSDLLTQRLQQRQAMRAAEAVPLANGRSRQQEVSDSDFGDDEAAVPQRQQTVGKVAKRQRAVADQKEAQPALDQLEADTEQLNKYQLSDDDDIDGMFGKPSADAMAAELDSDGERSSGSDAMNDSDSSADAPAAAVQQPRWPKQSKARPMGCSKAKGSRPRGGQKGGGKGKGGAHVERKHRKRLA